MIILFVASFHPTCCVMEIYLAYMYQVITITQLTIEKSHEMKAKVNRMIQCFIADKFLVKHMIVCHAAREAGMPHHEYFDFYTCVCSFEISYLNSAKFAAE